MRDQRTRLLITSYLTLKLRHAEGIIRSGLDSVQGYIIMAISQSIPKFKVRLGSEPDSMG